MTTAVLPPTRAADDERVRLVAEIGWIRALLGGERGPRPEPSEALRDVASRLRMSPFERDVLLLTAAVQLDGQVAQGVGRLRGDGDTRPTFALAMGLLPEPHWDALAPHRPLRRWRLVDLAAGQTLATRPLTIDEDILHLLTGVADGCGTDPLTAAAGSTSLTPSQERLAEETAATVEAVPQPLRIALRGSDGEARVAVAGRIAEHLGLRALVVADAALARHDLPTAALLLDRAALLTDRLIVTGDSDLLALQQSPLVVALGDPPPAAATGLLVRTVDLPDAAEQHLLWQRWAPDAPAEVVADLSQHYRLSNRAIDAIAGEWRAGGSGAAALRRLTRQRVRVGLGPLAQRLHPRATSEDLILPAGQRMLLHDLVDHVRHRAQVYQTWGFARQSERGLGITALFTGESGTGKTLAAEVLAAELGHDLYRIDLAAVVSKYIGETEKNLASVFDAAESSGAVLLFDEADALFGRRSDVKDSHDRYANLEVAYLLQRMESYRGLAILTTNLRSTLDRAFLRRLRFIIHFPFPDEAARAEIWRRVFPADAPLDGIDPAVLAGLQVSGGSIRAIALSAAFAAAGDGQQIGPHHILRAAQVEYAKAERQLSAAESAVLRSSAAGAESLRSSAAGAAS